MPLSFLELIEKILREENRPLTPEEIWSIAQEKGYDTLVSSKGKTPARTIGAKLYVDIRDNPDTIFLKASVRPTKFFLKDKDISEPEITREVEPFKRPSTYTERDLHSLLSYFLHVNRSIYSKTIFHEASKKSGYAQWLHPDMVGVYFYIESWCSEVFDIAREVGSLGVKLYSFEIKKELTFNNLRESFFQAVSNSSWAHEGYLVAAQIDPDSDFYQELKRLSNSFGIGIIRLDVNDPDNSEILIPAKEKEFVDMDTINRIAEINPDFRKFLKRIKNDITSREIRKEGYDLVVSSVEELKRKFAASSEG